MSKPPDHAASGPLRVRVDKWLWAARFFKTRSLAKAAIEGGKVHCNGERCKASRELEAGCELRIRQALDEKTVIVKALDEHRRGAPEASRLYEETPDSVAAREAASALRKAQNAMMETSSGRPTKQDRRKIHRFKEEFFRDDD